jgi:ADP-sugar diphosphatase
MQEKLEDAHKFKLWKDNLIANGLKINKIDEHYTRRRYNGEVLFSLLMLDAETPESNYPNPVNIVLSVFHTILEKFTSNLSMFLKTGVNFFLNLYLMI